MDKVTKFILQFFLKLRSLRLHIQMDVCKRVHGKKRRKISSTTSEVKDEVEKARSQHMKLTEKGGQNDRPSS